LESAAPRFLRTTHSACTPCVSSETEIAWRRHRLVSFPYILIPWNVSLT
jgi:hypothetical protein